MILAPISGRKRYFGGNCIVVWGRCDGRIQKSVSAVVNHPAESALAVEVARTVMGEDAVDSDHSQLMGAEDFALMLEQRPGNIALIGNGSTAGLHDPCCDFNDAAIPYGIGYWTRLVETAMPSQ